MSNRCKCCNSIIDNEGRIGKLRSLDVVDSSIISDEDEYLCSVCLGVARECYQGYSMNPEGREEYIRSYFYNNYDEVNGLVLEGYIRVEEGE